MPAQRVNALSKVRSVRFTDQEWLLLVKLAKAAGLQPSSFIREKTLGPAHRS